MSYPIIRVENLSKKYTVSHQQEGYTTFRDAMTNGVRSLSQRLRGKQTHHPSEEDFWALKDVNFEIQQGDRVGIIGRNGAGKSTLLKILSRITEPTHGSIRIRGRVASLLEVGTGFHPELTGRENIFLNGAILGMSKVEIKRKFDEIVDFAEIERFLDTPVKRYSSGMYVRLAFAVAAHLEPEVLIVDEVLAVGDGAFQKKCLGKMEDVASQGRTVLFVSHSMETVVRLCNTAILLDNGSVKSSGRTDQVIHTYLKSDFGTTAKRSWSHLDRPPGNETARLIEVKVHDEDGRVTDNFDISKPIGITIVYEVLKNDAVFTHSINLFNEHGINILNSHDITSDLRKKSRAKGYYSATMWIPHDFLAEGIVAVGVALLEQDPFVIHLHELDAVAFNVTDPMNGFSARGDYVLPFPGVVRPILNWEASRITEGAVR
jgi:lipopolysaccharide transport system ATP-binding protein